jgi:hypothetical protein
MSYESRGSSIGRWPMVLAESRNIISARVSVIDRSKKRWRSCAKGKTARNSWWKGVRLTPKQLFECQTVAEAAIQWGGKTNHRSEMESLGFSDVEQLER